MKRDEAVEKYANALPSPRREAFRAVLDLVRAECVVGAKGYPYAVETADVVAVLQAPDRDRFYSLFQQFAEAQGLSLHQSRKSLSKAVRRR